jgi:hypothetical protein
MELRSIFRAQSFSSGSRPDKLFVRHLQERSSSLSPFLDYLKAESDAASFDGFLRRHAMAFGTALCQTLSAGGDAEAFRSLLSPARKYPVLLSRLSGADFWPAIQAALRDDKSGLFEFSSRRNRWGEGENSLHFLDLLESVTEGQAAMPHLRPSVQRSADAETVVKCAEKILSLCSQTSWDDNGQGTRPVELYKRLRPLEKLSLLNRALAVFSRAGEEGCVFEEVSPWDKAKGLLESKAEEMERFCLIQFRAACQLAAEKGAPQRDVAAFLSHRPLADSLKR